VFCLSFSFELFFCSRSDLSTGCQGRDDDDSDVEEQEEESLAAGTGKEMERKGKETRLLRKRETQK
jgi:hypothetical protein